MGFIYIINTVLFKEICREPISQHPGLGTSLQNHNVLGKASRYHRTSLCRLRLDDYSAELEQSVVALTAQKQSVREERRQTLEMQARIGEPNRKLYPII